MNLLEVKKICKTYGKGETAVRALQNVSFSVPRGDMWRSLENQVPEKVPC